MKEKYYRLRTKYDLMMRFAQIMMRTRFFLLFLILAIVVYQMVGSLFLSALIMVSYFSLFHLFPFLFQPFAVEIDDKKITFYYFIREKYEFEKKNCVAAEKVGIMNFQSAKKILGIRHKTLNGRYFRVPDYWVDYESLKERLFNEELIDLTTQTKMDNNILLKRYYNN